jgi:hypothetical protein
MNAITSIPATQPQPSQQSHANAAAAALRQAIVNATPPLRDAVQAYRTARVGLTPDANLLEILRAAGGIVLAAEAIVAAGKQVEATARTALAQTMTETGCPSVGLASHVVHLSTKPARVDVEDERAIPPELMRQPPPAPDKVAIGKLLRAGAAVPGARLVGNQEPICVFRSCSQSTNSRASRAAAPSSARLNEGKRSYAWLWSGQRAAARRTPRCSSRSGSVRRSA